MSARLRWTLALIAVSALAFAAGLFLGRDGSATPELVTFPVAAPAGPAVSSSPATAQSSSRRIPATIHEILKVPGDFAQTTALYVLAASQDQDGIERLLDEARSIKRVSESRAAASILYERFAELDAEAAVEHMMRGDSGFDPNWLYGVFHSWARTDLEAALKSASKLDDHHLQMAGMAIMRSRDDLPREEREAVGSKLNLQISVREFTTSDLRSPKAAERAWQSAIAIPDRDRRLGELYRVAQEWARVDPRAAIQAIESLASRGERDQLLQNALHAWAKKDPRAVIDWVVARPLSYQRSQLLANALTSLAMKDPAAAIAFAERLPRAEHQHVMPQLLANWASMNPRAAAEWAEKQDDTPLQRQATMFIASSYAQQDPEEALSWAATLTGEPGQVVMSQVIQQIAQDDPERASSMVGRMKEGTHRGNAIGAVSQSWAQSDPRAALVWIAKQPSSDVTPDIYGTIFGNWANYDVDAAVSQLNFMLDTDDRNAAIRGILENAYLEPDRLDELFQRLEGAEARTLAAGQIYYRLREIDPRAAERYRIQAGISDERGDGNFVVN